MRAIGLTFAVLALAGCSATSDTTGTPVTTVPTASFEAPKVMAAGTSPIPPSKQAAFCQDQVANMYDAEPQNVVAHGPVVAADGSTTIDVTVDRGNGVKTFKCRLDAGNRFIDALSAVSDGLH
ncbi:hypothetical protein SAMN04488498_105201 [Mesorhizobium albiziae]|uniref:Uncharacterized protein n=1 Tax=Neomesorhizobium albiziae TaxID=335020 RepID=A0A1I3YXH0_9HYPH|nr:hypothetical protein SAMN04488498_105201 [Mesorhizobium albiziae]